MTATPTQEAANEAGRLTTSRLLGTLGPIEHKRTNAGYPIHPHSSLALDHQRMPGLLVSHSVDRALHHSLDCLWGLDQLLKKTGPQHYAPYLLIRGALETAATAVWLLDPDEPPHACNAASPSKSTTQTRHPRPSPQLGAATRTPQTAGKPA